MTVLSVAQDVAKYIGMEVPTALLSSTDREHVELAEIIQEMATRISRDYDWQKLSAIATITGDGSDTDFDLPSDYDRMIVDTGLWLSSLQAPLTPIDSLDKWLELDVLSFGFITNAWIMYGDQIHIKPALATGVTAKYFYQSNLIVSPASGSNKTAFTLDTDTYRLDEQLLKLGAIWRWKAEKGQAYDEEMADYEELKGQLIVRDRGSKMVKVGQPRTPSSLGIAYPYSLG